MLLWKGRGGKGSERVEVGIFTGRDGAEADVGILEVWPCVAFEREHLRPVERIIIYSTERGISQFVPSVAYIGTEMMMDQTTWRLGN